MGDVVGVDDVDGIGDADDVVVIYNYFRQGVALSNSTPCLNSYLRKGIELSDNAIQIFEKVNKLEINDYDTRNSHSKEILNAWAQAKFAIHDLKRAAKGFQKICTTVYLRERKQAFLTLGTLNRHMYNIALKESQQSPNCVVQDYIQPEQWHDLAVKHRRKAIYWFEQLRFYGDDQGSLELGYLYKELSQNNSTSFLEENALENAISYFEDVSRESSYYASACEELGILYQLS
jgi:hypothetical protein